VQALPGDASKADHEGHGVRGLPSFSSTVGLDRGKQLSHVPCSLPDPLLPAVPGAGHALRR